MSEKEFPDSPHIASEFEDMVQFDTGIDKDGYARYSSTQLLKREAEFTGMIPGAADVALCNSGAAALHTTLEAENLMQGDIVLCAEQVYSTTKKDVSHLMNRGIKVIFFDSTDREQLQELVDAWHPRLIIAETITNSATMAVVDVKKVGAIADAAQEMYSNKLTSEKILNNFLEKEKNKTFAVETKTSLLAAIDEYRKGGNPFIFRKSIQDIERDTLSTRKEAIATLSLIVKVVMKKARNKISLIFDNTLPSPHILNPLEVLKDVRCEKVIVESGTKHYQEGANAITMGLAYSDSAAKIQAIKERRGELGTYLQPSAERHIPDTITHTMPEIMKNHARNALQLAEVLSILPGFDVSHPNLPHHTQYDLVKTFAPQGAVTVFYVTLPEGMSGKDFMQTVKDKAGDRVGLGSSFGHSKTWLSNYSLDAHTVRIAAGSESREAFQEIINIFKNIER